MTEDIQDLTQNQDSRIGLLSAYIGHKLVFRFPISRPQLAEIAGISKRTSVSWTSGQTLSIRPTLILSGMKRKFFGFNDLFSFVIAGHCLHELKLPAATAQVFISHWQAPDFLPGVTYEEKMRGYLFLAESADGRLAVHYSADNAGFGDVIKGLGSSRWTVLRMADILEQTLLRLACWLDGTPYQRKPRPTRAEFLKVFRETANLIREVNLCEPLGSRGSK